MEISLFKKGYSDKLICLLNGERIAGYLFIYKYPALTIYHDSKEVCLIKNGKIVTSNYGVFEEIKSHTCHPRCFELVKDDEPSYSFEVNSDTGAACYYEDVLINSNHQDKHFIIRENMIRILFPLKLTLICGDEDDDLEIKLLLLAYFWLRKEITAHDTLN